MYTYNTYTTEQKLKAVKLYISNSQNEKEVIKKLGYPSPNTLRSWYQEYLETGQLARKANKPRFTEEQIQAAIQYVEKNSINLSQACRALGYPCRKILKNWIQERKPELLKKKSNCKGKTVMVRYDKETKLAAVREFTVERIPIYKVAAKYNVSRASISNWAKQMLGENAVVKKKNNVTLEGEKTKEELEAEVSKLKEQIQWLQMEKDALEKAAEILKKLEGIDLKDIRNIEKAGIIDALRSKYRLRELLILCGISRSSFYYCLKRLKATDKYNEIRRKVRDIFENSSCIYGYRRVHAMIKRDDITLSEKVIRRIMREEGLRVKVAKKRKYNSYKGEITPAVPNEIQRDFHAEAPNQKWLTDITEFAIPAGKLYLSPIIDCFDGLPISWTIGTSPNAELVNSMLRKAIDTLANDEHPILHSDRGCHYRWPDWIALEESAGLIRSMSKKGCSPDNSACEGFFGTIKNEMFYGRDWQDTTIDEFTRILDNYLNWFCDTRIKKRLGWKSPSEYRRSLGMKC